MIVEVLILVVAVVSAVALAWQGYHAHDAIRQNRRDLVMAKWELAERREEAREWRAEMLAIGKGKR